jgi:MSHA biogenesis protein MshN
MSLINEVLNELESRGEKAPLGEPAIRAVPLHRQSNALRYGVPGGALLIMLVAGTWYLRRTDAPASERSVVATKLVSVKVVEPASAPVAIVSAPVAAPSEVSGTSQPSDSVRGRTVLVAKGEDKTEIVPNTKKPAHHRSRRGTRSMADKVGNTLAESPEIQQLKTITPEQRAANEFSKANLAVQEGRTNDALEGYRNVLLIDPTRKDARRAWVGLLLKLKRNDEAESVLKKGLRHDPHDTTFAMLLARLEVESGDVSLALETLQKTLPYAEGQGEYQAFVAALFQRQNRHEEAVAHYQLALKLAPNNGIWLMGMGISLQALQRTDEARAAYQRALASNSLNAQLQAFVQNKLKEL